MLRYRCNVLETQGLIGPGCSLNARPVCLANVHPTHCPSPSPLPDCLPQAPCAASILSSSQLFSPGSWRALSPTPADLILPCLYLSFRTRKPCGISTSSHPFPFLSSLCSPRHPALATPSLSSLAVSSASLFFLPFSLIFARPSLPLETSRLNHSTSYHRRIYANHSRR